MTLGASYDSITDARRFSITQGDFVTMQVGADNDAAHARADSSDADRSAVTENRSPSTSVMPAKGLGISDSQVGDLADSQQPSTHSTQLSKERRTQQHRCLTKPVRVRRL